MIVKNESQVIRRCLNSVLPLIDYWVIVDTGSTDGTQDIIKNFMKDAGVAGEVHESPWVNFAHNRNEALELAKGKSDYILFIDADEVLEFDPDFKLPSQGLDKDFYYIMTKFSGTNYCRTQLISSKLDWKWTGVLHETVGCPEGKTHEILPGVANIVSTDGFRSKDPQKFHKDAQVLEKALKDEPNNSRYVFYLAQSYRDAGEYKLALQNYERYLLMEGWDQEIFFSMLQIALLQEMLEMPKETIISSYQKAYIYRPTRIEPLYRLAKFYRMKGDYQNSYMIGKLGLSLPESSDILFVEKWMHDYGLLFELSISAYWLGNYIEAFQATKTLQANKELPENVQKQLVENMHWITSKIIETRKLPIALTK